MPISPDRILFCDEHLLAVNKLSGELVVAGGQKGKQGQERQKGTRGKLALFDFLRKDFPGLRVLHRIDFETSGVVVFARTKKAFEAVRATNFAGWAKTYQAIVVGQMPSKEGIIQKKLPARIGGLVDAETRYRVLENFGLVSLVEATIETGRHHQIRQHFAMLKHPLVLDRMYGQAKFNQQFSQKFRYHKFFLHASSVDLPHPMTGKELHIEAPLPRAFIELLRRVKQ